MPPEADNPQDPYGQIVDKLKSANNVLVTVSKNPSVDQLAACIGLTLALNKLGKHATAVFSGEIPSTIEFLEPEKTIETNTDSLRDFIISLDKAKADKLRYKVEDNVVKIFITPYKTSIGEKDLEFSQGDFNVDAVMALGVHQRSDLDEAIVAHGRILHDAAILSINTVNQNELGSIDWTDESASSLCEMVSDVVADLGKDTFDEQIATAFLTGIVAQTERFSNDKAAPHTMSVAGILMAAGASTQLVASKLEAAETAEQTKVVDDTPDDTPNDDGTIQIDHPEEGVEIPEVQQVSEPEDDIHIDDHGTLRPAREYMTEEPADEDQKSPEPDTSKAESSASPSRILEPPQFGGQLTASADSEDSSTNLDPTSTQANDAPILSRSSPTNGTSSPAEGPLTVDTPPPEVPEVSDSQTLSDIERAVDSAHVKDQEATSSSEPALPSVDNIRYEVEQAAEKASYQPEPIAGLNAQDFGLDIAHDEAASATETSVPEDSSGGVSSGAPPVASSDSPEDDDTLDKILHNSSPPPPVPPPMMPPVA